jgi:hypothetical protein
MICLKRNFFNKVEDFKKENVRMSSIGCEIHWSVYRSVADELLSKGLLVIDYDARVKIVGEHIEKYALVARAAAKKGSIRPPVCTALYDAVVAFNISFR